MFVAIRLAKEGNSVIVNISVDIKSRHKAFCKTHIRSIMLSASDFLNHRKRLVIQAQSPLKERGGLESSELNFC